MKGKLVKYKNGWMVTYPINSVLVHPQDVVNLLDSMNGMEVEFEIVGIDIGSGISKGFAKIINKEPMQVVPHDVDYPTTTSDLIDGAIWSLPFDERIKCWDLIEKLVEESQITQQEISDEEIDKMANEIYPTVIYGGVYKHTYNQSEMEGFIKGMKMYRELLKNQTKDTIEKKC